MEKNSGGSYAREAEEAEYSRQFLSPEAFDLMGTKRMDDLNSFSATEQTPNGQRPEKYDVLSVFGGASAEDDLDLRRPRATALRQEQTSSGDSLEAYCQQAEEHGLHSSSSAVAASQSPATSPDRVSRAAAVPFGGQRASSRLELRDAVLSYRAKAGRHVAAAERDGGQHPESWKESRQGSTAPEVDNGRPTTVAKAKPAKKPVVADMESDVLKYNGRFFNARGYEICGQMNQHGRPCQRIGSCPFHPRTSDKERQPMPIQALLPVKKGTFKKGWSEQEHLRFLMGLQRFGKSNWKPIASLVGTRTAAQVQSHAQKYFNRQKQSNKNKRSIHDISFESLGELQQEPPVRAKTHKQQQIHTAHPHDQQAPLYRVQQAPNVPNQLQAPPQPHYSLHMPQEQSQPALLPVHYHRAPQLGMCMPYPSLCPDTVTFVPAPYAQSYGLSYAGPSQLQSSYSLQPPNHPLQAAAQSAWYSPANGGKVQLSLNADTFHGSMPLLLQQDVEYGGGREMHAYARDSSAWQGHLQLPHPDAEHEASSRKRHFEQLGLDLEAPSSGAKNMQVSQCFSSDLFL